jgi:hypothetical protein
LWRPCDVSCYYHGAREAVALFYDTDGARKSEYVGEGLSGLEISAIEEDVLGIANSHPVARVIGPSNPIVRVDGNGRGNEGAGGDGNVVNYGGSITLDNSRRVSRAYLAWGKGAELEEAS